MDLHLFRVGTFTEVFPQWSSPAGTRSANGLTRNEPLDIAAITREALYEHVAGELESVVALEPAPITGDPVLLERLAANLVSNAIRHNILGGRIEVATRTESGRAVLSVANSGAPIAPAELERLFQPLPRPRSSPGEGAGLGLAIVHAISEAHSATVTARARVGGGLEVDVSFPAASEPKGHRLNEQL